VFVPAHALPSVPGLWPNFDAKIGDGVLVLNAAPVTPLEAAVIRTLREVKTRAGTYIVYSQLSLLFFMSVCIALHPGLVLKWNEAGLSNYGIHIKTAVPYTLALGLCSFFAIMAARSLGAADRLVKEVRILLSVYGGLVLLSMLSTYVYTLSTPLKNFHIVSNIATVLFGSGASLWMYAKLRASRVDAVWLGIQIAGFILGLIDFFKVLHVLFLAQVFTGVGFGFLVVHAVRESSRSSFTVE